LAVQGSLTVAIRYGATRHQFGPPGSAEVAVLDYTSQQLKLMPMLATCYALHFTSRFLVQQYAEMKRTKEEDLVADVHALSAGKNPQIPRFQTSKPSEHLVSPPNPEPSSRTFHPRQVLLIGCQRPRLSHQGGRQCPLRR
jgi:hypothetical protein